MSHWVCVPEDAVAEGQSSVREFGAFTKDLDELVEWLLKCQVKTVAWSPPRSIGFLCFKNWSLPVWKPF